MKKSSAAAVACIVSSLLFAGGAALARDQAVELPPAGLTPESPFYFFDQWAERLREFFAFTPEAKAKLQIEFAGERIAEIQAMVDEKGEHTKGIDKAKALLLANVARAAEIVGQEKASGKDAAGFAKAMNDQLNAQEQLLAQTFLDARAKLVAEHLAMRTEELEDAKAAGDTANVTALEHELNDIQNQADGLQNEKDDIKTSFRAEKKKIEEHMTQDDQDENAIDQSDEDLQEESQAGDDGELELNQESAGGESEVRQKDVQNGSEPDKMETQETNEREQ